MVRHFDLKRYAPVISIFVLLLIILLTAFGAPQRIGMVIILLAVLALLGVTTWYYWVNTTAGGRQPLLLPKLFGIGWTVNPRNPIGATIIGILFVLIAGLLIQALIWG